MEEKDLNEPLKKHLNYLIKKRIRNEKIDSSEAYLRIWIGLKHNQVGRTLFRWPADAEYKDEFITGKIKGGHGPVDLWQFKAKNEVVIGEILFI